MPPRKRYPRLNKHFDVKHIKLDLNKAGASDIEVYKIARIQGRIIITINRSDFEPLVGTEQDCGIIAIPDGQAAVRTDTKLTSLLMKHRQKYFKGKVIALGSEKT